MSESNTSNNFTFLQKYQQLQQGVLFDRILDLGFTTITYWADTDDVYWNAALVDRVLTVEELTKIEETFQSLGKRPTIYFENKNELAPLIGFLEKNKYDKQFEESWMFYEEKNVDASHLDDVKKVETEQELEQFLETFEASYTKEDPQNPYGELGREYRELEKNTWLKYHENNRIEYFVAYKDNLPVATSHLVNFNGIGYIASVGSRREVRGQGYGKAATLYAVQQSIRHANSHHCLATEEGTYPNEFYKRIGFTPRFTASGYTKT